MEFYNSTLFKENTEFWNSTTGPFREGFDFIYVISKIKTRSLPLSLEDWITAASPSEAEIAAARALHKRHLSKDPNGEKALYMVFDLVNHLNPQMLDKADTYIRPLIGVHPGRFTFAVSQETYQMEKFGYSYMKEPYNQLLMQEYGFAEESNDFIYAPIWDSSVFKEAPVKQQRFCKLIGCIDTRQHPDPDRLIF